MLFATFIAGRKDAGERTLQRAVRKGEACDTMRIILNKHITNPSIPIMSQKTSSSSRLPGACPHTIFAPSRLVLYLAGAALFMHLFLLP